MSRILDYWEKKLRFEVATKTSLANFKPLFMSLTSTHPMFTTCSSNVYETNKSTCQAALLSGRFKSDYMSRHWDKENPDGHCVLCPGLKNFGTLEHLLITCETLAPTRLKILNYWDSYSSEDDCLKNLLTVKLRSPQDTTTILT